MILIISLIFLIYSSICSLELKKNRLSSGDTLLYHSYHLYTPPSESSLGAASLPILPHPPHSAAFVTKRSNKLSSLYKKYESLKLFSSKKSITSLEILFPNLSDQYFLKKRCQSIPDKSAR